MGAVAVLLFERSKGPKKEIVLHRGQTLTHTKHIFIPTSLVSIAGTVRHSYDLFDTKRTFFFLGGSRVACLSSES